MAKREYSQGVCEDGAAILCDGQPITIEEILSRLRELENYQWQPIETAPADDREAIVFRPLASLSRDKPIAIKKLVGGNNFCWVETVPAGAIPTNPTNGACHATHWMPLPPPPKQEG